MRLLVVRMSALGDIVHALPVLQALRCELPGARVDWLADRRYAEILNYVEGLSTVVIGRPGLARAVTTLRAAAYDVAIDLQGLLKSAAMARLSGASRVIGFAREALREPAAAWFYDDAAPVPAGAHVIAKNLSILSLLNVSASKPYRFGLNAPPSAIADQLARDAEQQRLRGIALINPGAAWPNKRWAPPRFGVVAAHVREAHGLLPVVLWGNGERALADAVVESAGGVAVRAPETTLADLLALCRRAALMVSGDTGPLHIAAAMGTPVVGLYGPTWPERNGPWAADDVVVSRAEACECHHKRQCRRDRGASADSRMCLNEISADEAIRAVDRRVVTSEGATR
jgi:heptosyltransferase I